jgi:hypothetical protein
MRSPLLSFFAVLIVAGCAAPTPTKPNVSLLYLVPHIGSKLPLQDGTVPDVVLSKEVKALFRKLASQDPGLALEVGKLPEFQHQVEEKTVVAFERFVRLVQMATPAQQRNLATFLDEGKPSVRRYCSPLQAIFWILEKGENDRVLSWPLARILDEAWESTAFESNAPKRWKDFTIVTERLNSPYLISYYEIRNFIYDFVGDPRHGPPPTVIFWGKRGTCSFYTSFTVYCLLKAGYKARPVRVRLPSRLLFGWYARGDHVVSEFVDKDGKRYVEDLSTGLSFAPTGIAESEEYYRHFPMVGYGYNM